MDVPQAASLSAEGDVPWRLVQKARGKHGQYAYRITMSSPVEMTVETPSMRLEISPFSRILAHVQHSHPPFRSSSQPLIRNLALLALASLKILQIWGWVLGFLLRFQQAPGITSTVRCVKHRTKRLGAWVLVYFHKEIKYAVLIF